MPEVVLPDNEKTPKAGSGAVPEHNIPSPPQNRPLEMKDYQGKNMIVFHMTPLNMCLKI